MKEDGKKILGYVFAALVVVGLVLVIVGMFVGQTVLKSTVADASVKMNLFDEGFGKEGAPSNVFAIISYIVTIVGLVVLLIDAILRLFLKKDLKIVRIVGAALAVVGAILILVSGLMLVSKFVELSGGKEVLEAAKMKYVCGAGVWLGFIGGLVGGVAGGLGLVKALN